jgi:hypothetical protein
MISKKPNKKIKSKDKELMKSTLVEEIKSDSVSSNNLESSKSSGSKSSGSNNLILLYSTVGIIVLILVSIILLSNISSFDKDDSYVEYYYNGFLIQGFEYPDHWSWQTYIQIPELERSHLIEMRFPPDKVEDIFLDYTAVLDILNAESILMTTDPDLSSKAVIAMIEVGRIIGQRYDILNKPVTNGLTSFPSGMQSETPIIECSDASESVPVLYYKIGETTEVYKEGMCIIIQGKTDDEIIMAADKLGYSLMGIIR